MLRVVRTSDPIRFGIRLMHVLAYKNQPIVCDRYNITMRTGMATVFAGFHSALFSRVQMRTLEELGGGSRGSHATASTFRERARRGSQPEPVCRFSHNRLVSAYCLPLTCPPPLGGSSAICSLRAEATEGSEPNSFAISP